MSSPLNRPEVFLDGQDMLSPDPQKIITPKKKLNLSIDVLSPDSSFESTMVTSERADSRLALAEVNSIRRTKAAKQSMARPRSLYLPANENMDATIPRSCFSYSPKSGPFMRPPSVPSPLHKSSSLAKPFSPTSSPLSFDKTLLKQIESPLGHMNLSSPAPFPSFGTSFGSTDARTESQDSDGFGTEMIEAEVRNFQGGSPQVSTAITQLISAPLTSRSSAEGSNMPRVSEDKLQCATRPNFHRCMSLSAFDRVKENERCGSVKRSIPFPSVSEPKRVPPAELPGTPTRSTSSSSSSSQRTSEKDHHLTVSCSPILEEKSPRSMSVDTPASSGKQNPCLLRSRSMSMSLFKSPPLVKEAHQDEEEHLIGDNSKTCCLPVLKGGHHKSISAQTLCDLMDGKYRAVVESFTVIDARYPYEYNGGHIKGSVNIWNHDMLEKRFFDNLQHPCSDKRSIYIFHCEFSSKRGPAMIQHLRNMDRIKNGVPNFPKLYYPEVYLLHGGYSVFFAKAKGYCDPSSYCEMHDVNHKEDLKHFARRSKSWTGPSYTAKRTCRLFSNPP